MSGSDQFQPTHRNGYRTDRLAWLLDWLRAHPDATLASGEGGLLAAHIARLESTIDRLEATLYDATHVAR